MNNRLLVSFCALFAGSVFSPSPRHPEFYWKINHTLNEKVGVFGFIGRKMRAPLCAEMLLAKVERGLKLNHFDASLREVIEAFLRNPSEGMRKNTTEEVNRIVAEDCFLTIKKRISNEAQKLDPAFDINQYFLQIGCNGCVISFKDPNSTQVRHGMETIFKNYHTNPAVRELHALEAVTTKKDMVEAVKRINGMPSNIGIASSSDGRYPEEWYDAMNLREIKRMADTYCGIEPKEFRDIIDMDEMRDAANDVCAPEEYRKKYRDIIETEHAKWVASNEGVEVGESRDTTIVQAIQIIASKELTPDKINNFCKGFSRYALSGMRIHSEVAVWLVKN